MREWLQLDERFLFVYSALFGIACGIASNHGILQGSWANLVFWGLIGVLLGIFAVNTRAMLIAGSIYGVFLVLTFLYVGYQGTAHSIPAFIGLSVVLAMVGAFCGLACMYIGSLIRKLLIQSS